MPERLEVKSSTEEDVDRNCPGCCKDVTFIFLYTVQNQRKKQMFIDVHFVVQ